MNTLMRNQESPSSLSSGQGCRRRYREFNNPAGSLVDDQRTSNALLTRDQESQEGSCRVLQMRSQRSLAGYSSRIRAR